MLFVNSLTAANLADIIEKHKPNLMFIHFDSIDDAGHGSYWGSQKYYDAVKVRTVNSSSRELQCINVHAVVSISLSCMFSIVEELLDSVVVFF